MAPLPRSPIRVVLVWLRRLAIALAAAMALCALLTAVVLRRHEPAAPGWTEFSIGPASGDSTSINASTLRSNGISLKGVIALAYDIPPARMTAPAWLAETRYSITAFVDPRERGSFRPLLLQELRNRLNLEAHVEIQPFDVFVLTSGSAPRLESAHGKETSIWVQYQEAKLQGSSMSDLASALQNILGKPVLNETAITGSYNLDLRWGDDRLGAVTTALRDRFGLQLSPAKRDMEALIVDSVRRDAALVLMAHAGRLARGAPGSFRQHFAAMLSVH